MNGAKTHGKREEARPVGQTSSRWSPRPSAGLLWLPVGAALSARALLGLTAGHDECGRMQTSSAGGVFTSWSTSVAACMKTFTLGRERMYFSRLFLSFLFLFAVSSSHFVHAGGYSYITATE